MTLMSRFRAVLSRISALFAARRLDAELDHEIHAHLDLLTEEHQQRGLSAAAARAAALRDFGGVARTKESYRDQRGLAAVETLVRDVRYAIRMAKRSPGFSLVVIVVLALAIGANSAMFTFVNALLFRPLPGRASEFLGLYSHDPSKPNSYRSHSYPNFADIRARNDVFEELIAYTFTITGRPAGDVMRRSFVEIVSSNFFSAIGVGMAAGRGFTPEEEHPGADIPVAIASYAAWQQAGFDPSFVGRTLRINARDFAIVGVAPRNFAGTTALVAPELWLPFGVYESVITDLFKNSGGGLADRSNRAFSVAGRLKPGLTIEQANARLALLSADLERAFPDENRGRVLTVHPLSRVNISSSPQTDAGPAVFSAVAMPLSGAVLLIACLNIANMLLARGTARRKEIAIRVALGGGRSRIVRQLLTESLVLALAGAAGGLLLGWWTTRLLLASLVPIMPTPVVLDARPDVNIVLATTAFAVLGAVAFGLAPALRLTRPDLVDDLKDLGAARSSGRRFGTGAWLVVSQIAVSLMLMTAGGLFVRGALRANVANPGYAYDGLLLASIDPGLAGLDGVQAGARLRDAVDRIRSLPGVIAAGANSQVPFGDFHESTWVARLGQKAIGGREPTYTTVTTDYFKAVGLPMLRGRDFTTEEVLDVTRRVAIIDEPLARRLFPGEEPLGQQLWIPPRSDAARTADNDPMTIVGIVPGIRDDLTERQPIAHLYVPAARPYRGPMHIHVRTSSGDAEMLAAIRRELRAVDSRLPVTELRTMREFHDRGLVLWLIRAAGRTLLGLAALALLLAAIGVYGVKSYVVAQRTREIGIRLALGASPREIVWMLLRDCARMTLVGVAIGLPLAIALGRLLSVAMFEVSPYDPVVLTLAPSVLIGAAALAAYLPARRGMRVSPLEALRVE
jgi:putative ABC transport system permease protein